MDALEPLGTDANKPFLEDASYIIGLFAKKLWNHEKWKKVKHYYANESVGIATGILVTALHLAGLSTLSLRLYISNGIYE